jgi:hypothetical protein
MSTSRRCRIKFPVIMAMTPARFPPPWSVEQRDALLCVLDHSGQKLAYVYYEEEPGEIGGQVADQGRGAADCDEYCEAGRSCCAKLD